MKSPLRQTASGFFLYVRASPKSGRNEIAGSVISAKGEAALAVKVTAVPDKGQANEAVVKTLAKAMGVSKSSFRLVAGQTSRDKVFELTANVSTVQNFLANEFFQKDQKAK